jgi:hypothetical protein
MAKKNKIFLWAIIILSAVVSFALYYGVFGPAPKGSLLHNLYEGGPLVAVLMTNILVLVIVVTERVIAYNKANGRGDLDKLLKEVKQDLERGAINEALQKCEKGIL